MAILCPSNVETRFPMTSACCYWRSLLFGSSCGCLQKKADQGSSFQAADGKVLYVFHSIPAVPWWDNLVGMKVFSGISGIVY